MESRCPKCKTLSKALDKMQAKYKDRIDVFGVVVPPENLGTVGAYINETKINFPVLFDSSQVAITYFKATPANPSFDTPHLFVVNPEGMIVQDFGTERAEDANLPAALEKMVLTNGKGK